MNDKYSVLQQVFGYTDFRLGQETLIDALLAGRDVLGVMPTGGGKSLCFQVPALLMPGVTLVISPLISLMKDQVMALKEAGVPAAYLNSSLSAEQIHMVLRLIRNGAYKIIYVAPERLLTDGFLSALESVPLSMIAVDEAHCISEWGQDFRPSYLKITDFVHTLPRRPVLCAFTATATERVRKDIVSSLELRDPLELVTGFDRPNLFFDVRHPAKKLPELMELLEERAGKSGIVYCSTRKQVDKLHEALNAAGISTAKYHAGMEEKDRHSNQEDFVFDRAGVMVATNAFGMGIDKSNVSFVIHYNMPKSLEEYYQEAGRAGRDGAPADCILLFSAGDVSTAKFLIENSTENEELSYEEREQHLRQSFARLDAMVGYCKTVRCLRGTILDYFGQKHSAICGNCGNCSAELVETDITRQAQMVLSCVRRVKSHLGYEVGASLLGQVLHGSRSQRVLELRLDTLSTYGILHNMPRQEIRRLFDVLADQDLIEYAEPYHTVRTTPLSNEVLFHGMCVTMRSKAAPAKLLRLKTAGSEPTVLSSPTLYDRLRDLRAQIARREHIPAYIVFTNATLQDMAAKQPQTTSEFLSVSGVGSAKANRYGKAFMEEIALWREAEH